MRASRSPRAVLAALALLAPGCLPRTDMPPPPPPAPTIDLGPGVARSLAEHRSRTISELSYEVRLRIPATLEEPVRGGLTARFTFAGDGAPLVLDFAAGRTEVAVSFTSGDGPLNRGADLLYTLFVPARARLALPVFDQPDLKARFRLTLELPREWAAVSNGAERSRAESGARATVSFAETRPLPTYPFGKLDFVALPAFPYGGMEHAGAIFYRDRSLFLDQSATQNQLLDRASLMAGKIVHPSFPEIDHELRFLLGHTPGAQDVDRTAGTHAIRQPLENLDDAGSLYGAILYDKAPIAMQHLERATGEDAFRDGLRAYLDRHRYANASWPDLIAALDPHTPEDLAAWSRAWIEEAGLPTLRTTFELDAEGTRIARLTVAQDDPAAREREPWVIEALSFLHHPLRAGEAIRCVRPSLQLLPEIQASGDVFFPLDWLEATLGGHSSPEAAAIVRDYLASRPGLPPRLRGKVLQAADPLVRAARAGPDI